MRGRRQIKLQLSFLMLAALLVGASSCNRTPPSNSNGAGAAAQSPARIISLSPSATEILYGVGAFNRVVAVSDFDEFPPEVAQLPKVGGWSNTNLEQVASLKPDLIVMTQSQAPMIKDKLDALGVHTLIVPSYTVEDVLKSMELIGDATGNQDGARKLIAETQAKLNDVRARTSSLPRLRVLCIVDRVPGTLRGLYTATKGSFIAQLIEMAGGESIAPPAATGFGQVSKEAVVTLNPDIVLDIVHNAKDGRLSEDPKEVWQELKQVKAVREAHVYVITDASVVHPSQFISDAARKFAEFIHPEAFAAHEAEKRQ